MRGMTVVNPELERFEAHTSPGMAHWAGTGPAGATCGKCAFYGYRYVDKYDDSARKPTSCEKYYKMTGKHGGPLDPKQVGCKYFDSAVPGR